MFSVKKLSGLEFTNLRNWQFNNYLVFYSKKQEHICQENRASNGTLNGQISMFDEMLLRYYEKFKIHIVHDEVLQTMSDGFSLYISPIKLCEFESVKKLKIW